MPRKRPPSPQRFDTDLLDPEALTTRVGLQTALRSVERVCNHNDASIELAIAELRGRPNVFEYIMSSTLRLLGIARRLLKERSSSLR